jgi:hypothetical protein
LTLARFPSVEIAGYKTFGIIINHREVRSAHEINKIKLSIPHNHPTWNFSATINSNSPTTNRRRLGHDKKRVANAIEA